MQIYITITITGTNISKPISSVYLIYLSSSSPSSNELFQLEPVGINGNIDFNTTGLIDQIAVPVKLVSSSATNINNYYSYDDISGEGTGRFNKQLITIVKGEGDDMGPWVLRKNGNKLEAIKRRLVDSSAMTDTQWTYTNNHWCLLTDQTSCILVDDPLHLPSNMSVGKISNNPREINQQNVYLGQRWRNIIKS
jgi:hypothetical protein